jgi:hypothetical protein
MVMAAKLPPGVAKEHKRINNRRHYWDNRDKYLKMEGERSQLKRYGITPALYASLLEEQGGKCGICRKDKAGKIGQRFAVDHDHATGEIRGLLCIKCNSSLGWFEPHGAKAIVYLATARRHLKIAG